MVNYFADSSATVWLQIAVPSIISVLLALAAAWAVIARYQQKVDTLEKNCDKQGDKIDDLKDRVSKLEGGLERDRANNDPFTKRESPISLTDRGKALLLDSGGNRYLENHKSTLIDEIKKKQPKSAYDVQEYAKAVITSHASDDDFVPLKNYLFKEGLDLVSLINVVGIALRDMALPALGFTPEQVDESDPNKKGI